MQALHLGPRNEPGFTRDLREQPADRVQAPFVDAACEQLPRLRHEVCNHAISLRQLIYGRNAVLEAARAGRVVKVYQAAGLGHDARLEELAAWEFDFTQRVCVVVGGEGAGVHRLVKERCDARVRLPVAGHIASFNASAAAAAALYEVLRQRASGKTPSKTLS